MIMIIFDLERLKFYMRYSNLKVNLEVGIKNRSKINYLDLK